MGIAVVLLLWLFLLSFLLKSSLLLSLTLLSLSTLCFAVWSMVDCGHLQKSIKSIAFFWANSSSQGLGLGHPSSNPLVCQLWMPHSTIDCKWDIKCWNQIDYYHVQPCVPNKCWYGVLLALFVSKHHVECEGAWLSLACGLKSHINRKTIDIKCSCLMWKVEYESSGFSVWRRNELEKRKRTGGSKKQNQRTRIILSR